MHKSKNSIVDFYCACSASRPFGAVATLIEWQRLSRIYLKHVFIVLECVQWASLSSAP